MAKLPRALQKIFGLNGATGQFGQIGSEAAGSPTNTKDIESIQGLSQYLSGLYAITSNAGEPPRIEDINSLYFMITRQLSYLFQDGIPEWDDDTDYFANSSWVQRNGGIYQATTGTDGTPNNGNDPASDTTNWREIIPPSAVSQWVNTTDYSTAGTIVQRGRRHYASSGKSGNTGQDPSDPTLAEYWLGSPGEDFLIHASMEGKVIYPGVHPAHNYNDADYQQNIKFDTLNINGTDYDFYLVHLDGDTVTGDTTLEDTIFKIGESDEYIFSDLWCPDELGTRVLKDARGTVLRGIDETGGMADTLAERLEDATQEAIGSFDMRRDTMGTAYDSSPNGVFSFSRSTNAQLTVSLTGSIIDGDGIAFDNADSTSPNAAKTDEAYTRDKSITVGVPYIIVMVVA